MQYALARTIRWLVLMATSLAVGAPAAATPASSLKAGVDAYAQGLYARSAGFAENLLGGAKVLSIAQRHEALCLLGQSRTRLGHYPQALDALGQAEALARQHRLRRSLALTYIYTGDVHERLKQHPLALEYYRKALAQLRLPDEWREARLALNQIGDIQAVSGKLEEAQRAYAQALAHARKAGDAAAVAQSLDYTGYFYRRIGDSAKAIAAHQEALRQAARIAGDPEKALALARAYNHLGLSQQLAAGSGENLASPALLDAAISSEEQALHYARQSQDRWRQGYIVRALSNMHLLRGGEDHLREALRHAGTAFDLSREMNNPEWEGLALHQRAVLQARTKDFSAAAATMAQALELWERIGDSYARGVAWRLRGAEIAEPGGDAEAARNNYLRALEAFASTGSQDDIALTQFRLSGSFAQQGYRPAAIYFGKQAVNTVQGMRGQLRNLDRESQQAFVRLKTDMYRRLAGLLIEDGRLIEAQQVVAMLKEEEFFDYVRRDAGQDQRLTQLGLGRTEAVWQERQHQANAQVAALGNEHAELRSKARRGLSPPEEVRMAALGEELKTARLEFDRFLGELQKEVAAAVDTGRALEVGEKNLASLRALQGTLSELGRRGGGTVVTLHYVQTAGRLNIILTTPQVQLARSVAVTPAVLNGKIAAYRQVLSQPVFDPLPLAQELYRLVILPVAEDLKQAGAATLMVSLDGALRYLPLAALHDGKQYLLETYRLALYTEAARDKIKDAPAAEWRLAGLGLTRAVTGFSALPGVKAELDSIVRTPASASKGVLPGAVYLDHAFTAQRMKQSLEYPVLHIASHFVFAPGTEAESYLLLGDGAKLSLKSLKENDYDFRDVDLITLSACDTAIGGGTDENGREIEGFGALAQRQGAKGVIATLWPVADASTGLLMREFYRAREAGKLSKAEALRRSQLMLLKGTGGGGVKAESCNDAANGTCYAHPFFWAPFILMGNWL